MDIKTVEELVKYIQANKLSEYQESFLRSKVLTKAWEQDDYPKK